MRSVIACFAVMLAETLVAAEVSAQAPPPPSKQSCSASHTSAQELRLDGKLIEARSALRICADAACPSALATDCASWLAEVQQAIPSVVFMVEADTGDASSVKISVDGQVVASTAEGSAHEFEPGAHVFRFELSDYPVNEQMVVLRQGEKRRVLRVQFEKPRPEQALPVSDSTGAAAETSGPAPAAADGPRPVPIATYIFGGIALAAAGTGAYLGLDAIAKRDDKQNTCAPSCADEDVDGLKTQLLIADAAGAVALISAGVATYLFLTRPVVNEQPQAAEQVRISVTPHALGLELSKVF